MLAQAAWSPGKGTHTFRYLAVYFQQAVKISKAATRMGGVTAVFLFSLYTSLEVVCIGMGKELGAGGPKVRGFVGGRAVGVRLPSVWNQLQTYGPRWPLNL